MRAYLAAFVVAALVAIVLTPVVRHAALRLGAVDRPGDRHVHKIVTPRLGGVAICVAFLVPMVGLFAVESSVAARIRSNATLMLGLIGGAVAMNIVGVIDDTRGLRALHKLYLQLAVAVFAYICGFRIDTVNLPLIGHLSMGIFAVPVTVFWIVGIINAVNLIDGLDGLAAGVVFFAAVTNLVVAYVNGSILIAVLMSAILGATLGFLFFNFNPARIFMGDSGSYFLGYVLATGSLAGATQKASTAVSLLVPIIALGVPIFDTLFSIVRRFLERRPMFAPDRGHIHHRLLDLGITHRRAVLILYGVSVVFTVCAVAVSLGRNWQAGVAILTSSVVLLGLVRFVGYFEYLHQRTKQKRRIRSRHTEFLRRVLPAALFHLDTAGSRSELLQALADACADARLHRVEVLTVEGRQDHPLFTWSNPGEERDTRQPLVTARYPLYTAPGTQVDVKFGWQSEYDDVSPQVDILLQVLVDAVRRRAEQLSVQWVQARMPSPAVNSPAQLSTRWN